MGYETYVQFTWDGTPFDGRTQCSPQDHTYPSPLRLQLGFVRGFRETADSKQNHAKAM